MAYALDPNASQDPNRPPVRRNPGGGGWVWIVVIIIAVVIIWFAVAGGTSSNTRANPANANSPAATQNTSAANQPGQTGSAQVTDAGQLVSGKEDDMVGQQVQLDSARVADVASGGAFLLDANGKQVLVVPASAASGTGGSTNSAATNGSAGPSDGANAPAAGGVSKGDVVSIQGTVEKLPSEHDAMKQFNLSSDEAARAQKAGVYINARSVQPAQK